MKYLPLLLLAGCASAPPIEYRTIDRPVPVIVAVPEALTAPCPVAPLLGTTNADVYARLAGLETCRVVTADQLLRIRQLGQQP